VTAAIGQVPASHRKKLLIRADSAGASHELLDWITALDTKRRRSVEYSVGYAVTDKVRDAIVKVPKTAWKPAITADGEPREHADGWRYQAVATNTKIGQVAFLEARHPRPRPRPRRGPDPPRQGLRHRPVPVPRVRYQPSLGAGRLDRRRPDRVAALARPAVDLEGVRAEGAAIPVPARPPPA